METALKLLKLVEDYVPDYGEPPKLIVEDDVLVLTVKAHEGYRKWSIHKAELHNSAEKLFEISKMFITML